MRSSSAGVVGFRTTGAVGALCRMLSKITAAPLTPGNGCFPCDQLVEHRTERKTNRCVRPALRRRRLFRRTMYAMVPTRCPPDWSGGVPCPQWSSAAKVFPRLHAASLARPKSRIFTELLVGDKNVRWLDVTVHNSFFVCAASSARRRAECQSPERVETGNRLYWPATYPASDPSSSSMAMKVRPSCSSMA